jgi:hypothetical protein
MKRRLSIFGFVICGLLSSGLLTTGCHEHHERIHDRTVYVERDRDYHPRHDRDHYDHHDGHHDDHHDHH